MAPNVPLTVDGATATAIATTPSAASQRAGLIRRARLLVVAGQGWHVTQAVIALAAGISAASTSLVAFGADVTVEAIGGLVVLWRFSGARAPSARAERIAQRLIAASYWLIAAYIAFESSEALVEAEAPEASTLGIAFALCALVIMPLLRRAKGRVGMQLGSAVVTREGIENMLCAYLAVALLAGLAANALLGWWWADPVAAYVIAAIALVGGWRAWHDDACCVETPGTGLVLAAPGCTCDGDAAVCCDAVRHAGAPASPA